MSNLLNIKDQSGNWIPIPVVTNGIKSITQNEDYTLTITLNDGTTYTTTSIKGEDGQDYVLTENDKQEIAGLVDTPVDDVQINGTSIVTDGVANIPVASNEQPGVVKVFGGYGLLMEDQFIRINPAATPLVKSGLSQARTIVPANQHEAAFYGLAKASGDTTQSQSDNEVGVYTNEAKASIKNMLGVEDVDIDSKAPVITETISGDIASFDDGADDMPLQSLIVDIEPKQDLHGYDSPWVGGGGKNIFNVDAPFANPSDTTSANTTKRIFTPGTYCIGIAYSNYFSAESVLSFSRSGKTLSISTKSGYGVGFAIAVTPGQQYFISCTAQSPEGINHYIQVEQYAADGEYLGIEGANRINDTFTAKENAAIAVLVFRNSASDGNPAISTFTDIQVESGSTATEYAPYENICPITGWTEVNTHRTGKNLLGGDDFANNIKKNLSNTVIDTSVGTVSFGYSASTANAPVLDGVPFKENTRYTFVLSVLNEIIARTNLNIYYTDGTTTTIGMTKTNEKETVIVSSAANKTVKCLSLQRQGGTTVLYYDECGVFEGVVVAADFVPYTGQSYSIVFPEEAGTIYGGYVDIGKGALNVEWAQYILDGTTQKASNLRQILIDSDYTKVRGLYYVIIADFENSAPYNGGEYICSHFKWFGYSVRRTAIPDSIFYDSSKRQVCWVSSTFTTLEEFNQYLADQYNNGTPVTLVYKNGYTTEIPITSMEIRTLLGDNNIWSDTGNVNVTYRADTELYIDKQIPDVPVQDIQINGTSVVSDGVANVPVASTSVFGTVKTDASLGITINSSGKLVINRSTITQNKLGADSARPIVPFNQHESTFYGLAKAAGADEKDSTLPVGQYTDSAQTAIKQMLGVKDDYDSLVVEVSGTDPVITGKASYRYNCGELYTLSITPPSSGTMDIIFTSGATPTVLTLPETVKMPDWWAGIETNTTYEMCITDGTYCGVMSWAT